MSPEAWATFVASLESVFDGFGESRLQIVRGPDRVEFNGISEENSCEPCVIERVTEDNQKWFCKTLKRDYTFVARCALLLLSETGGATYIHTDDEGEDHDRRRWIEAADWMTSNDIVVCTQEDMPFEA